MSNAFVQPITYGRLSEILISLGFSRRDTSEYIVFQYPEYNALFALPITQPQEVARPAHLVAAQSTITASGVASARTFQRMLNSSALEDARVLSETTAAQSEAA